MPPSSSPPASPPHTMQCMEVWGGNGLSDNGVTMPGIDAWVLARPFRNHSAGGDIHYVSSCGTGRISRIMLADVAGHGDTVAQTAAMLRSLMRRYVNYVDQSALVARLNAEFAAMAEAGRFATALIATFWAPTGYLALSNAGHPRPLVYSSRARQWRIVETRAISAAADLPLGVTDDSAYGQFAVRLRPGDLMILYTDSLIEAALPEGGRLGERGLLELVRTLDPLAPADLARTLYDAVIHRCAGATPDDDTTIIILRCNGVQPHYTLAQRLGTQLRFIAMVARSLRPGGPPAPWPEARLENLLGPVIPALNRRPGRDAAELGD